MKRGEQTTAPWWHWGLGGFFLAFVAQVVTQRFLFADGAHFLVDILVQHGFSDWDYPRQYAHYVTQWPVALAIALSVRDVAWLARLYGASLFCVPLVSMALCRWLTPRDKPIYPLLLLPAFAYIDLNSAMFIISESHLAAGLVFVLLFFVLLCEQPSRAQAAVAALSALAMVRVYESFAFMGPLLSALALQRLVRTKPASLWMRTALLTIVACGIAASGLGLHWMIWSERNVAQVGLGRIAGQLLGDFNFLMSSLLMAGLAMAWLLPDRDPKRARPLGLALAVAAGLLLGLLPLADEAFVPARLHYPARVLNIVVPLAMAMLLVWQRRRPGLVKLPARGAAMLLCALLAWNTAWQVSVSNAWRQYTETVMQTLRAERGVVPVQNTPLRGHGFIVHWALPSLSIVLQAMDHLPVQTLIEPGKEGWQPFDPRQCAELPKLGEYGVSYPFCAAQR